MFGVVVLLLLLLLDLRFQDYSEYLGGPPVRPPLVYGRVGVCRSETSETPLAPLIPDNRSQGGASDYGLSFRCKMPLVVGMVRYCLTKLPPPSFALTAISFSPSGVCRVTYVMPRPTKVCTCQLPGHTNITGNAVPSTGRVNIN